MKRFLFFIILPFSLFVLTACGSNEVTLSEIAIFPGATAVNPGDDSVADTLMKNMEQDAALRADLGIGGSVEQIAHKLPSGTSWEEVKDFYDEALAKEGWDSGLGGIAGKFANDALEAASEGTGTSIWSKDKQTLTLLRLVDPVDQSAPYLIFSLATN